MTQQEHREAIVVGAGPVGMVAALALRHEGMKATILEAEEEGRFRPGSRAIYIHKATLKLIEEVSPGLGFKLAENGVIWPVKRTTYRGKDVYVRHYPAPTPGEIPAFTSLAQVEIEKYMYQACLDAGVEFVWDTQVTDVQTTKEHVRLKTASGTDWIAPYVIGADGSRSAVRKGVGIELEGPRANDTFLVVDIKEDAANPMPLERTFHYEHPAMDGRNVLLVPFKGGWRVDLQLLEGDDPKEFGSEEGLKAWLRKVMNPKYAERVTWVSTYQFYQVVAESFTDESRRVLLVGEAAHLFAPFGARGLNSGVPDAIISVRGVAKAMKAANEADRRKAVELAAEERLMASRYNRDAAGTALEHIQGNSPYMNLKRELAASLTPLIPKLGRWLDEGPYGPKQGHPMVSTKY
ncbi:FAD-dependent monooxygenase [Paenibacillus fonticola]|uniref:FAD-dependent monooxygenase n=1 Tax=Paenibacillus fonticola TaxID=379896 RepID=UPI0003621490|nr:FAD-dependent monooxygenase [Paenibacillus fonticola]